MVRERGGEISQRQIEHRPTRGIERVRTISWLMQSDDEGRENGHLTCATMTEMGLWTPLPPSFFCAGINNLMDKLERLNADLEIMMGEVRPINPIVGNVVENVAKSMGLTVTMNVMSHCSVGGGRSIGSLPVGELAIPNITNEMGVDSASKVDDLLDDA